MISGTMNLSYLIKLVEPTKTSLNAYAFIVSPEGRLIAHPDKALVGDKEAFISIPQITAGFQGAAGTYSFTISGRAVIGSVLPFSQNRMGDRLRSRQRERLCLALQDGEASRLFDRLWFLPGHSSTRSEE